LPPGTGHDELAQVLHCTLANEGGRPLAMPRPTKPTTRIELGDLIAVAYEEARSLTWDDNEAIRLATVAITELLASTQNDRTIRDLAELSGDPYAELVR
jgi:hypothetical protein